MKKINKIVCALFITSIFMQPITALAYTKKETVYVNLDASGKANKTTVNNHLYVTRDENIEDQTELKDILNINGKEKFNLQEQKLTWENKGKDIFYQGTTEKELPISVNATYYLDEKKMDAKDMVGKSGKIRIELEFSNNSYIYKNNKKIYTPIVLMVGTTFSDKENTNIEVTNGKAVDTGTQNIVVALAAPGVYESTGMDVFKDLDRVTFTYETTKFSLNNIYMVATPKLLEETDFSIFDQMDTLTSSMNVLQENMNKIEAGAKELEEGSQSLTSGANQITENLHKVLTAINQLEAGSLTLDSSIQQIITTLQQTNDMLTNQNITGSISQLETLKQANIETITSLQQTNESAELKGVYETYQLNNFATTEELMNYFSSVGLAETDIKNLITCKKTYEANIGLITLLTKNNEALTLTISSLTNLSNQITTLLTELTNALQQVKGGTTQLSSGLSEVKDGVSKLYTGSTVLQAGTGSLGSGITSLSSGITTLNKEGIQTLTSYSSKAKNYTDQVKEVINLSEEYQGYTASNVNNTVFIYKMPTVK